MSLREGKSVVGIEEHEVDVVIVGAGGGGAPAARTLATAGLDVMVLEAGPVVRPQELTQRAMDTVRRIYVDKGAQETADGTVQVLQGSCVGGSTLVNAEVCFPIPDAVLDEWASDFGVRGMSPDEMRPVFEDVMETIGATEDSGRPLTSISRMVGGFEKLGLALHPPLRSVRGCRGCNYCLIGCAYGCKQSVDRSYLPAALEAGATVISDARVETLDVAGGAVREVVARTAHGTLRVRARAVVLACGAIATPLLLQDNGLGGPEVGEHLALHPICGPIGRYATGEGPGKAAVCGYCDDDWDRGYLLEAASLPLDFFATLVPGYGAAHRELARSVDELSVIAAIVRDSTSPGRVTRDRKGNKRIEWSLDAQTEAKVRRGIRRVAEIHFAAGATEVILPQLEIVKMRSMDDAKRLDELKIGPGYFTFLSYHPQGTARMGAVTDFDGRVQGTDDLYVMDTSLFPSPVGVNTQVPVMAVSTLLSQRLAGRLTA